MDIGTPIRKWEAEPVKQPESVPSTPTPVPAPPVKEPVPA